MRSKILTYTIAVALSGCGAQGQSTLPQDRANVPPAAQSQLEAKDAQYRVINLGTLGGPSSGASSINNRGWVAGISSLLGNTKQHATLWRDGAKIDLGTLGGSNSGVEWPVKNNNGIIAGISETSTPDPLGEAFSCAAFFPTNGHTCLGFMWRNGIMTALPTLGGNNDYATGVNDPGEIVGWAENATHDSTCVKPQVLQFEAVIWGPATGRIRQLPPLRGDLDGAATAINNKGDVVGISGICDQAVGRFTAAHAVLWHDDKPMNLGSLGGVSWNTPTAINSQGEVVGFANLPGDQNGAFNPHAFLWTKGRGMRDLGTLPGDTHSQALGINDCGQIVGVSYRKGSSRAFIWQKGVMTDLNTLIAPGSSLSLLYANDINGHGEIVGGACVLSAGACTGETPAFEATPTHKR
ncbi:MAG: hypothetical protein GIW98_01795 [Candidatus Eremiobacteraeota bacterium]|nr:hypothetical protein [Candidatus Eremiobacteraeota bacterium]